MEKTKRRIDEIDMVKGLAILYVFLRHINELTGAGEKGGVFTTIILTFSEGVMVLFFVCSGYVFKSKGNVLADLKNKAKQLVIPLLLYGIFNTIVYFIKYVIIDKEPIGWFMDNTIMNFLGFFGFNIRTGMVYYNKMLYGFLPYWFIMEMITAYLVFILVHKVLEKKRISFKVVTMLSFFLLAILCNTFDVQHTLENTFHSPVSYFIVLINIFGCSALLMLGNILKEYEFFNIESKSKKVRIITVCISLFFSIIVIATYDATDYIKYAFPYGRWGQFGELSIPITCLGGLSITYLGVFIFHYLKKNKVIYYVFKFMGSHSMDILMIHCMVAEIILWINGTWQEVYNAPYPPEAFSWGNWFTVIIVDAVIVIIYIFAKDKIKNILKIQKLRRSKT